MSAINTASRIPKHVQAANLLKRRIAKGLYRPGTQLPPVRILGGELGVSLNVVQRAVRLLEHEGLVETRHGVGVQVLGTGQVRRSPLTFGLIYPFNPDRSFAGTIHCYTEMALDLRQDYCIAKSSGQDPARERKLVEQFIDNGIEGLMIWPCACGENSEFYREVGERTPLVFVDRRPDHVAAPSVVLDWAGAGRDVVLHLASQGCRRVLVLEETLEISPFRDMFDAMKDTVRQMSAEQRFAFVPLDTTAFTDSYPANPQGSVAKYRDVFEGILRSGAFDGLYCVQDEFLDRVYACEGLAERYPVSRIVSMSNTLAHPRSLAFLRLHVREWIGDFGKMIAKAAEVLHEMVHLRTHPGRQHRIKFDTVVRTPDGPQISKET